MRQQEYSGPIIEGTPRFRLDRFQALSVENPEFVTKLMGTFTATIPPLLNEMMECALQCKFDRVAQIAHRLKSSFVTFGVRELYDHLEALAHDQKAHSQMELKRLAREVFHYTFQLIEDEQKEPVK